MSTPAPLQTRTAQAKPTSNATHAGSLMQRKCACGSGTSSLTGVCTECESKQRLQAKLTIGASNDPLEQKADRIADQVLAAPANSAVSSAPPRIQRFTGQPSGQADTAPASVDRVLAGPGRALDPELQQDMEPRFGYDFGQVRVHTDAQAAESARAVNALAYTVGRDVVFGTGQYAPGAAGQRLLAHELTHVVQQRSGPVGLQRQVGKRSTTTEADVLAGVPGEPPEIIKVAFLGATQTSGSWKNAVEKKTNNVFSSLDTSGASSVLRKHFDRSEGPFDIRIAGYSWGGWSALELASLLVISSELGGLTKTAPAGSSRPGTLPTAQTYGVTITPKPQLSNVSVSVLDPVSTARSFVPGSLEGFTVFNIYQTNGCFDDRCPFGSGLGKRLFSGQAIPGATNVDVTTEGRDGPKLVNGVPSTMTPDHVHLGYEGYGDHDKEVADKLDG